MHKLHRHGLMTSGGPASITQNLILALKAGASVPSGWTTWSSADGYFLKGTESDAVVGTTATATSITGAAAGFGGEHDSNTNKNSYKGNNLLTGGSQYSPSRNRTDLGGHIHYELYTANTPGKNSFKLVQAGASAVWGSGLVGFATGAMTNQALYSLFSGSSGFLHADTATQEVAQNVSMSLDTTDSTHNHKESVVTTALGIAYPGFTGHGTGDSGPHSHDVTADYLFNLNRALCRAYEILDSTNLTGLIGIWINTGSPPAGWSYVTELNNRYMQFSDTAAGETTGTNKLELSNIAVGSSGSHGDHNTGSYSGSTIETPLPHNAAIAHNDHDVNVDHDFEPDRFYVKFIKYTGA